MARSLSHPAGMRIKLVGQELSLGNKLLIPCRIENKSQLGRSHSLARSLSHPAGMRIKLVGQELFLGKKLIAPCRNENKACGAGAIPWQQASHTLPE